MSKCRNELIATGQPYPRTTCAIHGSTIFRNDCPPVETFVKNNELREGLRFLKDCHDDRQKKNVNDNFEKSWNNGFESGLREGRRRGRLRLTTQIMNLFIEDMTPSECDRFSRLFKRNAEQKRAFDLAKLEDIRAMVADIPENQKVNRIKHVRNMVGCSLLQAKFLVDQL